jgi:hypothetical protein
MPTKAEEAVFKLIEEKTLISLCACCDDNRVDKSLIIVSKPGVYASCKHCHRATGRLIPANAEPTEHLKYSYV